MIRHLAIAALLANGGCSNDAPCDPNAPGTICTIAGNGHNGFGGDNGPALDARLSVPQDVAIGPDGRLYILDFNNYCVRAIDPDGTIRGFVGIGAVLGDASGVPARQASFNHTTDLYFDGGNYLYLAGWHNSRIKRVDLTTTIIENLAGLGKQTFFSGDEGPALDAAIDYPSSVAIGPDGNLYFMDQSNEVIRYIDAAGIIHLYAGTCIVSDSCGASGTPVACDGSEKLACDPKDCASFCTPGYTADGPADQLRMGQPYGQAALPAGHIAFDPAGNLVFADSGNNILRRIDKTTRQVTTIAGTPQVRGASGDGGPATAATLDYPLDVEVTTDGTVYFTDQNNNCIRKVTTDGIISTIAGTCGADPGFAGDGGDPLQARFDRPAGIELAGDKIYVADSHNNRIRVINAK